MISRIEKSERWKRQMPRLRVYWMKGIDGGRGLLLSLKGLGRILCIVRSYATTTYHSS